MKGLTEALPQPAWACIFASFCIYVCAGREIFKKGRQLRNFTARPVSPFPHEDHSLDYKTTQVRDTIKPNDISLRDAAEDVSAHYKTAYPDTCATSAAVRPSTAQSVAISSDPSGPIIPGSMATLTYRAPRVSQQRRRRAALEANKAAWAYTKVAVLFFISLLMTWVRHLQHPSFISSEEKTD